MKKRFLVFLVVMIISVITLFTGCQEEYREWIWGTEINPSEGRTTQADATNLLTYDGCYTWWTNALTLRYVGEKDQTYMSYVSEEGALMISAYNHATGDIEHGQVAKFKLVDDHNSCGVQILPNGKILAVYSRHNADNKIRWKISKNAEDVTSFGEEQYVECEKKVTYAQLHRISDEEYRILYRAMNCWGTMVYNWVEDSWSEEVLWLKEGGGQYYVWTQEDATKGRINIFMTSHPKTGNDQNVRYGYYDMNGKLYNMAGEQIGDLNVQQEKVSDPRIFDVIYQAAEGEHTRLYDASFMGEKIGVMYGVGQSGEDTSKYYYAYYDEDSKQWVNNFICDSGQWIVEGNMYFGGVAFDKKDMQTIYVTRREGFFYRIERWKTNDYGATWEIEKVIEESTERGVVFMRPMIPYNAHDDIDVFYIKGYYPSYSKFNTDLIFYAD